MHEPRDLEVKPVGTKGFWSPRIDADVPNWHYSADDDWISLALTLGSWLGVYAPVPDTGDRAAAHKLGSLRTLLGPSWVQLLPEALGARLRSVMQRVEEDVLGSLDGAE